METMKTNPKTGNAPLVLLPSQIPLATQAGLVRNQDYIVANCLICMKEMDHCQCGSDLDAEDGDLLAGKAP